MSVNGTLTDVYPALVKALDIWIVMGLLDFRVHVTGPDIDVEHEDTEPVISTGNIIYKIPFYGIVFFGVIERV